MLKACKHSDCAVCKQNKDRNIFESIFQNKNPEIVFCEHAMYKITNFNGVEFILTSLENVNDGKQGHYLIDIFTSRYIYLKKENFEVMCSKEGECDVTPHVTKYSTK